MKEIIHLRTIEQAYKDIKALDPNTAISKNYIRELVLGGYIPFLEVKTKRLIDLDNLVDFIRQNMFDMKERQGQNP